MVLLITGDRILIKAQTAPAEKNGVYTVNATEVLDMDEQGVQVG
jgi:hypothetical protein